jgi:hypothetical protein
MSAQGGLVIFWTDEKNTLTTNTLYGTVFPPYGFLIIKLSTELLAQF